MGGQSSMQPTGQSTDSGMQQIVGFINSSVNEGQDPVEVVMGLLQQEVDQQTIAQAFMQLGYEEEQLMQFRAIIADKLSVRAVEEKVKNEKSKSTNISKANPAVETKKDLSKYYDTPIKISQSANGSGKILMNFSSEEEFQRLIKLLLNK